MRHLAGAVSLGIGFAVCVAMFSLVDALSFRALPGIADRFGLAELRVGGQRDRIKGRDYRALEDSVNRAYRDVALEYTATMAVLLPSGREEIEVGCVSSGYFGTLGTQPSTGTLPGTLSDQADTAAVISERLSETQFGGASIGESLHVGDTSVTVVGVMPVGFSGLWRRDVFGAQAGPGAWLSWDLCERLLPRRQRDEARVSVAARFSPGMTVEAANALLAADYRQRAAQSQESSDGPLVGRRSGLSWSRDFGGSALVTSVYLLVPLCILAVGCVNVVNMQLAHSRHRMSELRLRVALGASRWSLTRLLAADVATQTVVAAVVSLAGLRLSLVGLESLLGVDLSVDVAALAFCGLLLFGVLACAGLIPGWLICRPFFKSRPLNRGLLGRGPWVRRALVATQTGICAALLLVSGLGVRSATMTSTPHDPRMDAVIGMKVRMLTPEFASLSEALRQGLSSAIYQSAGLTDFLGPGRPLRFKVGMDSGPLLASGGYLTAGARDALGLTLLAGREPSESVGMEVLVNRRVADLLEEHLGSAVGKTIEVEYPAGAGFRSGVVTGIVDSRSIDDRDSAAKVFVSMPQPRPSTGYLVARVKNVGAGLSGFRQMLDEHRLAGTLGPLPYREFIRQLNPVENLAMVGSVLGLLALAVTASGIYALLSYEVVGRLREVGIRMALGADRRRILVSVLGDSAAAVLAGAACGLGLGIGLGTVLRSGLPGVAPWDVGILTTTFGVLCLATSMATLVPALSAVRVNPAVALQVAEHGQNKGAGSL